MNATTPAANPAAAVPYSGTIPPYGGTPQTPAANPAAAVTRPHLRSFIRRHNVGMTDIGVWRRGGVLA